MAAEVGEPRIAGLQHRVLHVGVVARLEVVHRRLPDTGRLLAALGAQEVLPAIGLVHPLDPDLIEHLTGAEVAGRDLGDPVIVVVDSVEVDVVREPGGRLHGLLWPLPLPELQVGDASLPALLEQGPHEQRRAVLDEVEGPAHVLEHLTSVRRESPCHPVGLEPTVQVSQLHPREREAPDRGHQLGEGGEGAVRPGAVVVEEGLQLVRARGDLEEPTLGPARPGGNGTDLQEPLGTLPEERAEVLLRDSRLAGGRSHCRAGG